MGKTYKPPFDDNYPNDLFEDDLDLDFEFDEEMEQFLDKQGAASQSKRMKGSRGRKKSTGFDEQYSDYRLPRDWRDFDYAAENPHGDDG